MKHSDDPLIFQNAPRHRHDWLLPAMIIVSLGLHAISFYIFQAAYPVSGGSGPIPASLSILNPRYADNQKILAWIENHDPSQVALDARLTEPPSALTEVVYKPGFSQNISKLLAVPDSHTAASFPLVSEPSIIKFSFHAQRKTPEAAKNAPVKSVARFSNGITLINSQETPLKPPAGAKTLPAPTRLLIEIGENGTLRHAFLQDSSGIDALDQYAILWLQTCRFATTPPSRENALHWGYASVAWGGEVFGQEKK